MTALAAAARRSGDAPARGRAARPRAKRHRNARTRRHWLVAIAFLAPSAIPLLLLVYMPMVRRLTSGATQTSGTGAGNARQVRTRWEQR